LQATNAKEEDAGQKDKDIRELQKKVDMLTLELAQKDASRESSQREMLSTGVFMNMSYDYVTQTLYLLLELKAALDLFQSDFILW